MRGRGIWRTLVVLGSLWLSAAPALAVPALPEERLVEGEVVEYAMVAASLLHIEPPMTLYRLKIRPAGASAEPLEVLSKEPLSVQLFGRQVRARALCQGDEWGGRCWLGQVEALD